MVAYSFKQRFKTLIMIGLGNKELVGNPKLQTIRADRTGKNGHAHPGGPVSLFVAQRTKQCERLGDTSCTAISDIVLNLRSGSITIVGENWGTTILTRMAHLDQFSVSDGFIDFEEMRQFWRAEHGDIDIFAGKLIQWKGYGHIG